MTAGIALALFRLYGATNEKSFFDAGRFGLGFERRVYSSVFENWPDYQELRTANDMPRYSCRWCNGAAGIGLARLGTMPIFEDEIMHNEIRVAINATVKYPMEPLDQLCCGNFGRLELLISAGHALQRVDLLDLAERRTAWILSRTNSDRGFLWQNGATNQNPGLFTEVAGVGYQLLRFAHPHDLASVLLLD